MNSFDDLLAAIDAYAEVKQKLKADKAAACSDWDCGIAGELEDSFASAAHREELQKARKALEDSIDHHIDHRIQEALKKRSGG